MIGLTALLVRSRWRSYLVVVWLAAVMGGLAVAGTLHPISIADQVAEDELRAVPLSDRSLIISQTAIESDFTNLVGRARLLPRFTAIYTEQVTVTGDGVEAGPLVYRDGFCAHIRLVAGRCPVATGEVALPEQVAKLKVGDQTAFSLARQSLDGWVSEGLGAQPVGVVGIYAPIDPAEDYWGARRYFTERTDVLVWPILAVPETLKTIPQKSASRAVDLLPDRDLIMSGDYQQVRTILADARVGEPNSGLRPLMERIAAKRDYTRLMTPVVVLPVLALGLWALIIVVGAHMQRDRMEVGVQVLRGLPGLRRWWLIMGGPAVIVAVMVPVGAAAVSIGWGRSSLSALVSTALMTVAAIAAVVIAALPLLRAKVADVLRSVPPRRGTGLPLVEITLAVVAGAALLQLRSGDRSGIGLYAATLVAAAAAVLAARVVPLVVRPLAGRAIRRGRIITGIGLALFSRRGTGRQLLALTALAVSLFTLVTAAVSVSGIDQEQQVRLETGAARTVSVSGADASTLLAAVQALDPEGRFALVAGQTASATGGKVFAIDLSRASLVDWSGAADAARVLRPSLPAAVQVSGTELTLALEMSLASSIEGAPEDLYDGTIGVLLEDARFTVEQFSLGRIRRGTATYRSQLPDRCAQGCRIAGISIEVAPWVAGRLKLRSLTSAGGTTTDFASWHLPGKSSLTDVPIGTPSGGGQITWILPPDAAPTVPVLRTTGQDTAANTAVWRVSTRSTAVLQSTKAGEVPVLPRVGADAGLIDLLTVRRATADGLRFTGMEVWLTEDAPADVAEKLRGAGLIVGAEQDRSTLLAAADRSPTALTLRMHNVAVIAAIGLLLVAVLFIGAGERRAPDLAALRTAGLSRRRVRRAVRSTYLAVVILGTLLGLGAAALAWLVAKDALPIAARAAWLPVRTWPDPVPILVPLAIVAGALIVAVHLISADGFSAEGRKRNV
ncbi:hypothetical protein F4553_005869 [Allocatelliglobosispora scoriae]|uniref:ABC3 transporter permease C-terminal domain-containing protein n=1 Tax=Allocatelliglobosispora scoriae TaxID=643052 RepID=A0A841BXP9_9ACTN|nr:FtsX-like permease family protein [Allocatelliglobosispora scoriae]MBB5872435.1 hypothetical protein [Allocatelliglobosispora scoriae]